MDLLDKVPGMLFVQRAEEFADSGLPDYSRYPLKMSCVASTEPYDVHFRYICHRCHGYREDGPDIGLEEFFKRYSVRP